MMLTSIKTGELTYLTANGFEDSKSSYQVDEEQVKLCRQFIKSNCEKLDEITDSAHSYRLKHRVEETYQTYISNGAFIQAAIEECFDYEHDGLNATFNLKIKQI